MKRNLWTQGEVAEMGRLLGLKNFDRRTIGYWEKMGIFPAPVAKAEGVLALYDDEQIESALIDIGKRMRNGVELDYDDIAWAKEEVLKSNRARNMSLLLKKIKARKSPPKKFRA